jgi:hypothetical protein
MEGSKVTSESEDNDPNHVKKADDLRDNVI